MRMDKFVGVLIRKERIRRNFSQEGLCHGICAVSYLSKIEKGIADASEEILVKLLERLGVNYETEEDFLKESGRRLERLYEAWFSLDYYVGKGDFTKGEDFAYLQKEKERLLCSRYLIDTMLMLGMEDSDWWAALEEYAVCMTRRQYEAYLYVTEQKEEELLRMNPNGFYTLGIAIRRAAEEKYDEAIDLLQRAYELSCREGNVHEMMLEKLWLGNCWSSRRDGIGQMLQHFQAASRIAKAIGAEALAATIPGQIGTAYLEQGAYEEAAEYLRQCTSQDAGYYGKLALCLEQTGEKEAALSAVRQGQAAGQELELIALVEYRLCHENYLKDEAYEKALLSCFARIEKEGKQGLARMQLPLVTELLENRRRYKEICQLQRRYGNW